MLPTLYRIFGVLPANGIVALIFTICTTLWAVIVLLGAWAERHNNRRDR